MSPLIKPHPLSISIALLAALPMTAPPTWAQQTNLITNGGFERGTDPGTQYTTLSAGSTNIAGWTIVSGTTVDYVANTFWQTSEGQRNIDLNGTSAGAISQSFPTEKGKQYQVLFDLAGNPDGVAVKSFNISAGNNSQAVSFNTSGHTLKQMGYMEKSLVFTATAETTTLTFTSLVNGAYGAVIDNVRVFPFQAVASTDNCVSNSQTITFQPALKWKWTGSSVLPSYNQVMHAPIVAPLLLEDTNGDGRINYSDAPSVVFQTFAAGGSTAVLRAVSGKDGHELWTVTDSKYRTNPHNEIAVADIDNDGKVEIVTPKNGGGLIAFEHDGKFKWQSEFPTYDVNSGGPAIADLDGNGKPEIVIGNIALKADGSLLWKGEGFIGNNRYGPLSIVADINLDGKPEVIAGAAAYSNTGSLLWQNKNVGDGFVAFGNFNTDKYPEIAIVSHGEVFLLDHNGEIIWGPVSIPKGGHGGAPTIADMDGDGKPNIGVAGAWRYVVFKEDGNILWTAVTSDGSSNVTGSSVFDFNGDGQAEVVYADERYLRIYRGRDGTVLAQLPNHSATAYELPVIADVDNDGHADIVVSTNYGSSDNGIHVYQDERNTWVKTRPLWNQHSYHVTNINDDGSVPRFEKNSWLASNTYRLNILNKVNGSLPLAQNCPATPTGCQLYGVNDQDANNSQFLSLSVSNSLVTSNLSNSDVRPLCETVWEGYDIEGLAIDTAKDILYASSGDDVALGSSAGHLYSVDAKNCQLFSIGETGFDDVASLAITPDGTLYGWAKGQGLILIDPNSGKGTLLLPSEVELEDLTASREQKVLYGAVNRDLWKYNLDTQTLEVTCTNLPGQTEGMAVLSDGLLLVATHQNHSLKFVDLSHPENGKCNILDAATISTSSHFEDVEGLAVPLNVCSVWGTQLFQELQGELPDEVYRARLRTLFGEFVDLPKVDVPPKTPSEIISQLPKEELKKFLVDLQQRIFKEYIGKVSDVKIQEFFDELPTELPKGYSNGIADKIVMNLPKQVREQLVGEMSVPKLTMLVEERLNGFLDEVLRIKKNPVLSLFTPKQIRDIALVPALNWAIKELVGDVADRLSLYLVAEVINQLPACFLSELIEKTED